MPCAACFFPNHFSKSRKVPPSFQDAFLHHNLEASLAANCSDFKYVDTKAWWVLKEFCKYFLDLVSHFLGQHSLSLEIFFHQQTFNGINGCNGSNTKQCILDKYTKLPGSKFQNQNGKYYCCKSSLGRVLDLLVWMKQLVSFQQHIWEFRETAILYQQEA